MSRRVNVGVPGATMRQIKVVDTSKPVADWYAFTASKCRGNKKRSCDMNSECNWSRGRKRRGSKRRSPGFCRAAQGLKAADEQIASLFGGRSPCKSSKKTSCVADSECQWKKGRKTRGKSRRSNGHCSARHGLLKADEAIQRLFEGGK